MENSLKYDKTNPKSIFEYGARLVNRTLRKMVGDEAVKKYHYQGKGGFNQMIEKLYFGYEVNSSPEPDFKEAGVELKGTGLKRLKKDGSEQIKERLVIDMIDFCKVVEIPFEESLFYRKFRLMLLIFYLYEHDVEQEDWKFLYVALWKMSEKDLLIIKNDYRVIIEKIKRGEAHLLSEGDTEYLGACRKGQKGDALRKQPYSEILAPKRAFSLKQAYMRTVLEYIKGSGKQAVVNYELAPADFQIASEQELQKEPFEQIILNRFSPYLGKSYQEICLSIGRNPDTSKSRFFNIASFILLGRSGNVNQTEEFRKAGIQLKTIRVDKNGKIKESMSFENIDYVEILETKDWYDSRLYEIFSGKFLFVVMKADNENTLRLSRVFFWTMPAEDLESAKEYWTDIRRNVAANNIDTVYFYKQKDDKKFHVRPKARKSSDLAVNPHGGTAKKFCYWFNKNYVTDVILKDFNNER